MEEKDENERKTRKNTEYGEKQQKLEENCRKQCIAPEMAKMAEKQHVDGKTPNCGENLVEKLEEKKKKGWKKRRKKGTKKGTKNGRKAGGKKKRKNSEKTMCIFKLVLYCTATFCLQVQGFAFFGEKGNKKTAIPCKQRGFGKRKKRSYASSHFFSDNGQILEQIHGESDTKNGRKTGGKRKKKYTEKCEQKHGKTSTKKFMGKTKNKEQKQKFHPIKNKRW